MPFFTSLPHNILCPGLQFCWCRIFSLLNVRECWFCCCNFFEKWIRSRFILFCTFILFLMKEYPHSKRNINVFIEMQDAKEMRQKVPNEQQQWDTNKKWHGEMKYSLESVFGLLHFNLNLCTLNADTAPHSYSQWNPNKLASTLIAFPSD